MLIMTRDKMAIKLQIPADEQVNDEDMFEAPPIVRFDERRMHVRAYNYWASLLGDKSLPSIEDLNPSEILDFGSHSVLLDFTAGHENPAIAFLGTALAAQCDVDDRIDRVSQIPARTLLSRLTDHYLQIIANAAPIGFEAEFVNQRGVEILYRGIMMPFSSDDDTIDFVYGVINWKEVASADIMDGIAAEVEATLSLARASIPTAPIWADGPSDRAHEDDVFDLDGYIADESVPDAPTLIAGDDAELADHLAAARDAASIAFTAEGRSRQALYRAVGLAHAFALLARARREDYLELLADAALAENARNPTATLVRLVFGVDYDKTRMAEFARAIDHAICQEVAPGALAALLGTLEGGLKAYVAQARALARGNVSPPPAKPANRARKRLAAAASITADALAFDDLALAVAVVRRREDGSVDLIGALSPDDRLSARVMQTIARAD